MHLILLKSMHLSGVEYGKSLQVQLAIMGVNCLCSGNAVGRALHLYIIHQKCILLANYKHL